MATTKRWRVAVEVGPSHLNQIREGKNYAFCHYNQNGTFQEDKTEERR